MIIRGLNSMSSTWVKTQSSHSANSLMSTETNTEQFDGAVLCETGDNPVEVPGLKGSSSSDAASRIEDSDSTDPAYQQRRPPNPE